MLHFNKQTQKLLPDFTIEKTTEEISILMNQSKRSIELKRDKMKKKANSKTIGGLLIYALKRRTLE